MDPEEIFQKYRKTFARIERAGALMEMSRWREALDELNAVLAEDPENYFALGRAAACRLGLNELQAALDLTKRAIAVDPLNEWAYRIQSSIFEANGEAKRSLEAAERCCELAPEAVHAIECLFWAQARCGRLDDAEKTLERLRAVDPDSADSHSAAGFLALERKQFEEAEKHYLEALKVDPQSIAALNNLGVIYLEYANAGKGYGYRKRSAEMFERAVRSQPTFKMGQANLAAASKAVKVGLPAGLLAVIWFGLRLVSWINDSSPQSPRTGFHPGSGGPSLFMRATDVYLIIVLVGIAAVAVACIFRKQRDAIFYQLTTIRGWSVISAAFGLSTLLYLVGFWLVRLEGTTFSRFGFGISLLLVLVSILNLLQRFTVLRRSRSF